MNKHVLSHNPAQLVFITDKKTFTNSKIVADYFGKRHCDVLRKIDSLLLEVPAHFASTHFCVHGQQIDIGSGASRDSKVIEMTKDGFTFLVMGFTGAQAAALKIKFIEAFNDAQARLSRTQHPFDRQRMMFTWEGGKIVSSQPIDDDQFVTKREKVVQYVRDPRFFTLEQLLDIQAAATEQIAKLAHIGREQARLR